jgi:hypothetical protein
MLDLARVNQQISRMAVEQQLVAEDRLKRLDKALGQLGLESGALTGRSCANCRLVKPPGSWLGSVSRSRAPIRCRRGR